MKDNFFIKLQDFFRLEPNYPPKFIEDIKSKFKIQQMISEVSKKNNNDNSGRNKPYRMDRNEFIEFCLNDNIDCLDYTQDKTGNISYQISDFYRIFLPTYTDKTSSEQNRMFQKFGIDPNNDVTPKQYPILRSHVKKIKEIDKKDFKNRRAETENR